MNNEVAIIILNYKNWRDTIECLESVFKITYQPYRVIVVDNDSQNGSLDEIEKWFNSNQILPLRLTQQQSEQAAFENNPVVLIQSASNRGYAAGNNIGIRWAIRGGDPYVLILNNDTIVQKDFLEPLADFLDKNHDTAMVGPLLKKPTGEIDRTCARIRPTFWDYFLRIGPAKTIWRQNPWYQSVWYFQNNALVLPFDVEVISGSCVLVRMNFLKTIGLLDEHTFLFAEEYILSEQIKRSKKTIFVIPQSSVIHKHGQSIKKSVSSFMLKTIIGSHFYYLRKYRSFSTVRAMICLFWLWVIFLKVKACECTSGCCKKLQN